MLSEDYQLLDSDSPRWLKIPNRDDQPTLPFYVELVTKGSNPRIPTGLSVSKSRKLSSTRLIPILASHAPSFMTSTNPREELSHLARCSRAILRPARKREPALKRRPAWEGRLAWEGQPAWKAAWKGSRSATLRSFVGRSNAGQRASPPTTMRAGLAGCWKTGW
jgi:hypothetical protein